MTAKRHPRITLVAGLAAGLWVSLTSCTKPSPSTETKPAAASKSPPPNILLISLDSLRPDHLGCYGYARKTSPRLDQFAAEGAVFENAFSSTSWTLPAHTALFTSLPDSVHGCLHPDQHVPEKPLMMAERLKTLGYATAGFYSGPFVSGAFGFNRGFSRYTDCSSYEELLRKTLAAGKPAKDSPYSMYTDIANPHTYREAHKWLTEHQERPFFLFVHMWDVHMDYIPPEPYDRLFDPDYTGPVTGHRVREDDSINKDMPKRDLEHLIALYDGEIAWTDMHVGKLLDDLDELHLRDSTLVVIISDHGEEFFEHGNKGHQKSVYDEVTHIVMLMRYPGHVPAGFRTAEQMRIIDVLPTTFELAGLPAPDGVLGQSVAPLFSGHPLPGDNLAISELVRNELQFRAFRRPGRKLIMNLYTGATEMYDLTADPREQSPFSAEQNPKLAEQLLADAKEGARLLQEAQRTFGTTEAPAAQLPEGILKQLGTLGYVGVHSDEDHATSQP